MKNIFLFSILICLAGSMLSTGCKDTYEYTGAWEMDFSGTCFGTKTVMVNDDGSFGFQITCGGVVNKIEGSVDLKTGKLNASLSVGGGSVCPTAIKGQLNKSGTGSGTFDCLFLMAGDWTAQKIN